MQIEDIQVREKKINKQHSEKKTGSSNKLFSKFKSRPIDLDGVNNDSFHH